MPHPTTQPAFIEPEQEHPMALPFSRRLFTQVGLAATVLTAVLPLAAQAQGADTRQNRIVVASFGGQLDETYKKIFAQFEKDNNVTIDWVPGTAPNNVAKLAATRNAPEYDVVLFENVTQRLASTQDLLAPIDTTIVTNYQDTAEGARAKDNDGVGIGAFVTGIYYRKDAFAKNGWAAPTSWNDLARPEFCNHLGLEKAGQVYTLNAVLMLAGADVSKIDQGISRFTELAKCARVLEPAAAKHEEKILLGEYQVGVSATIRTLPLVRKLPDLAFVLPKEGAIPSYTMVAPVKGAPNAAGAQKFINWFLAPQSQQTLVRELFYSPVNTKVEVPADLVVLGVPTQTVLAAQPKIDNDVLVKDRRDWTRKLERALER
ncbi:extracellular solute-binding protein [Lampropedia puyangensis]|uniref:Extracellular solute-binding protein n=1 Tax=Lampropedia puyangensis TaxID=1330072 RepID=A0A4S8FDY7_9BURK|nr:extracellular solute-binding protein [Lampropedia puyangensis]THU05449.1 extracellular solute-binding protein [Lampropedia puyangensis]